MSVVPTPLDATAPDPAPRTQDARTAVPADRRPRLVGDLQTTAMISAEGVVDWFCSPRFDSPSVFAALLDHERGGHFAITADAPDATVRQLYLSDTAVLITRFLTADGVGEVIDLMPLPADPTTPTGRHRLIRIMRVTRGRVRFGVECRPRLDYARAAHTLGLRENTAHFAGAGTDVFLQAAGPVTLERDGDDITASVELGEGELAATVLTVRDAGGGLPTPFDEADVRREFEATMSFWHRWIRRCRYRGRWQDMVNRSAITLKLLTYAPTGAPVAAATMGLPEQLGGQRNWDYRYTWVRDASLSVKALVRLGFTDEANAFRHWLADRFRERRTINGDPLQIMYRVDGDPHLREETLDHLKGYHGSGPVRMGNGAAGQLQLDIYGEAAYALPLPGADRAGVDYDGWLALSEVLDWLAHNWDRPDYWTGPLHRLGNPHTGRHRPPHPLGWGFSAGAELFADAEFACAFRAAETRGWSPADWLPDITDSSWVAPVPPSSRARRHHGAPLPEWPVRSDGAYR
ncbi:glycoside hydrolase family 15 protein [Streptomyces sp. NPDC005917]|uniref:glycoside hydrolase family 15 protein n=1 Tax=unclassified Streptomyces TaxID=2593676 RepID=UPI0033D302C2